MGKPAKPRTDFPYYKVHTFNDKSLAWMDARREAFDTLAEAEIFIAEELQECKARILEVTESGRRVHTVVGPAAEDSDP